MAVKLDLDDALALKYSQECLILGREMATRQNGDTTLSPRKATALTNLLMSIGNLLDFAIREKAGEVTKPCTKEDVECPSS
jgi:hypothetical protein